MGRSPPVPIYSALWSACLVHHIDTPLGLSSHPATTEPTWASIPPFPSILPLDEWPSHADTIQMIDKFHSLLGELTFVDNPSTPLSPCLINADPGCAYSSPPGDVSHLGSPPQLGATSSHQGSPPWPSHTCCSWDNIDLGFADPSPPGDWSCHGNTTPHLGSSFPCLGSHPPLHHGFCH